MSIKIIISSTFTGASTALETRALVVFYLIASLKLLYNGCVISGYHQAFYFLTEPYSVFNYQKSFIGHTVHKMLIDVFDIMF